MAYNEDSTSMRPKMGDISMTLPITFDYSGGRRESRKQAVTWGIVFSLVVLIISIAILFGRNGNFFTNILLSGFVFFIGLLILRYGFMKESNVRKNYNLYESTDLEQSFQQLWGIYSIDESYPYYVRYRNGRSGLFIKLNKDVILGKYSESEYSHYEAIGDAYNIAGSGNISMCHVDYMDNVGSDERLLDSFAGLGEVDNTDLKDVLTDMFSHLQKQMNERVTTFDVYVFTYRGSDIAAWNSIQRILSCLMDANYVSYHIMDSSDLRDLFKALYNIHEFSVNSAMLNSFSFDSFKIGITPIKVIHEDGSVEILNKTSDELEEERRMKAEEEELKEKEKRRRKEERKLKRKRRKGKNLDENEEIDLFE